MEINVKNYLVSFSPLTIIKIISCLKSRESCYVALETQFPFGVVQMPYEFIITFQTESSDSNT